MGIKKGSNLPPFHVNWMVLPALDDWHNDAKLILVLTLLGSLVSLTHHLNLLLLHPILAHLRILANAHLITGTLLRDAITYMASHNVKLLHASKIGNVFHWRLRQRRAGPVWNFSKGVWGVVRYVDCWGYPPRSAQRIPDRNRNFLHSPPPRFTFFASIFALFVASSPVFIGVASLSPRVRPNFAYLTPPV